MEKRMVNMKFIIISLLISFNCLSQSRIVVRPVGSTYVAFGGTVSSFNVYNIVSYGAVGDNSTNNTTAIQNALNAANAAGGGVVYVPSGAFKTNKVVSYTNVTIKGDGYKTSILRSNNADTLIAIHNAVNNNTSDYLSNKIIEDVLLEGNSRVGTVGLYIDGAANFTINRTYINSFLTTGLLLKNCLVGAINECTFYNSTTGIKAFAGGGNVNATTLVQINHGVVNYNTKWGIDWSGGGQLKTEDVDFENNGSTTDTLTGCVYYHANRWPGGLTVEGGWAESNYGTIICIMGNATGYSNYPANVTHSIIGFQDLGQQFSFPKRNVYIQGDNQRLGIINSSLTGTVNNIVADGVNNIVTVLNSTFDAANTNLTRNGATIVTK